MNDLGEVIYNIEPIDTLAFDNYSLAELTVIRFSANDKRVIDGIKRLHRKRIPTIRYEWTTDYLLGH